MHTELSALGARAAPVSAGVPWAWSTRPRLSPTWAGGRHSATPPQHWGGGAPPRSPPQGPWPTAATGPLGSSGGHVLGKRHLQLPLRPLLFFSPCPSALTSRHPSARSCPDQSLGDGPPSPSSHPPHGACWVASHPVDEGGGRVAPDHAWVRAQVPCPAVSTLPAIRSPVPPWPLASVSGGPWKGSLKG